MVTNMPQWTLRIWTCMGFIFFLPLITSCLLLGGFVIECNKNLGICPPPEVGVLVDEGGVSKSVWIEDERIGDPFALKPTLRRADVDAAEGTEIIFMDSKGFLLLSDDPLNPTILRFIEIDEP